MSLVSSDGVLGSVSVVSGDVKDLMSRYRAKFHDMDRVYCGIFDMLTSCLSCVFESGVSVDLKHQSVLQSEFYIVGLRSRLLSELSSLNCAISGTGHSGLHVLFSERRDVVLQYLSRLGDLRGDIDVIQRTRYADSWRR